MFEFERRLIHWRVHKALESFEYHQGVLLYHSMPVVHDQIANLRNREVATEATTLLRDLEQGLYVTFYYQKQAMALTLD